ncbi:hypothetical protein A3I99_02350 [Candidatus Kaiserbacteria bacterium RIFCSPLOWO2_02_FULL_45_11b]|uniref:Uncharacterized protein n=1 Tax=Candidatus Kaiserbacteria bacterium RIFCSPLOWO2_12_FULL_45_26 TaxID=1798525 RepID=A0A1F6FF65_9BACT|nr:MAG: hypothetical protein A2Z56_01235 [Candidatus Kaiserbacteria bacterium RIFCSPHIGHO2_12_45_16]OGG70229.1 MAG: hypothetical protein A2929_04095 [Candidatus Kaiserbacteria bacterium RIFCSPLOWO2_01_FULL_45_25]OGG81897.1 MAG: hypothetical protein A3I99_02350 [Candidatus Kaiserbacteria bacterium RIFCSPLOWO2_02_FULL_45_11b]OGG84492.1 MAG: hypothetical protein A3G90_00140 [Candidatus Kaiserbacteria bacterium RIFCSPLOWO2_12_FULL_45_26]
MLKLPTSQIELRSVLKFLGLVLLLGAIGMYVAFQARFLITGPQIVLDFEPATQQNERMIRLTGSAYNITHLWLNDRQIFTDEEGYFDEALVLENGYTITTLRAKDRYGRETRVVRSFVYTPASIIKSNS